MVFENQKKKKKTAKSLPEAKSKASQEVGRMIHAQ